MFPLVEAAGGLVENKINSSYLFTEIINGIYLKEKLKKKKKFQMLLLEK